MTTTELQKKFNLEFGLSPWPASYQVDHETYANVCQTIFGVLKSLDGLEGYGYVIMLGPHKGIMFKNVELMLPAMASSVSSC